MESQIHLPEAWSEWKITKLIGAGSYGSVYKAERKLEEKTIISAVKVISIPPEEENTDTILTQLQGNQESAYTYYRDMVRDFEREIQSMDALKGITNIVSIEDYAIEKRKDRIGWLIYLRMEFLTCFTEYQKKHILTEKDVIRLGIDISTALTYCEKENIIHRDIKPENIFVSKHGNFKLGDFGISRQLDRTAGTYTQKGTFYYMAPEVYHNERYGASVDQYSLGLVLYMLMNDNLPPLLEGGKQLYSYRDRQKALAERLDGKELPAPKNASKTFAELILKACAYKPTERFGSALEMRNALLQLRRKEQGTGTVAHTAKISKPEKAKATSGKVADSKQDKIASGKTAIPGKTQTTAQISEKDIAKDADYTRLPTTFGPKLNRGVITLIAGVVILIIVIRLISGAISGKKHTETETQEQETATAETQYEDYQRETNEGTDGTYKQLMEAETEADSTASVGVLGTLEIEPETEGEVAKIDAPEETVYSGKVSSAHTYDKYTFTVTETGKYNFSIDDMTNSSAIAVLVEDAMGNRLYTYAIENIWSSSEPVFNLDLKKDDELSIYAKLFSDNSGTDYRITVTPPMAEKDISKYKGASNEIRYDGQTDKYLYVPKEDGEYWITATDTQPGQTIDIECNDSCGTSIGDYSSSYEGSQNENGTYLSLSSGKEYHLTVSSGEGIGPYTFSIIPPQKTAELFGYTSVTSNMMYYNTTHYYTFTPDHDVDVRFVIEEDETFENYGFEITDSYGNSYYVDEPLEAKKGQQYQIAVSNYSVYGPYTIDIKYGRDAKPYQSDEY